MLRRSFHTVEHVVAGSHGLERKTAKARACVRAGCKSYSSDPVTYFSQLGCICLSFQSLPEDHHRLGTKYSAQKPVGYVHLPSNHLFTHQMLKRTRPNESMMTGDRITFQSPWRRKWSRGSKNSQQKEQM